jgi:hypothetical protein
MTLYTLYFVLVHYIQFDDSMFVIFCVSSKFRYQKSVAICQHNALQFLQFASNKRIFYKALLEKYITVCIEITFYTFKVHKKSYIYIYTMQRPYTSNILLSFSRRSDTSIAPANLFYLAGFMRYTSVR